MLQTFVLLRSTETDFSSGQNTGALLTQIFSILLSLYAISDKLITDDKKMFIEQSGANKAWKPRAQYYYRVFFRVSEVISNLCLLIIIGVFYGAFWFCWYFVWLLFVNYILYSNGLLGEDVKCFPLFFVFFVLFLVLEVLEC